jgi:hypothetical protein
MSSPNATRTFVPAPPFPAVYGATAAVALGLGLFGGFAIGLYALGGVAFGWPAWRYLALIQAHGQVQMLGLAGLLIVGVAAILLPGFWRAKVARPRVISYGGALVGVGLVAQLIGQPLEGSPVREILLVIAAVLPVGGFGWAGSELARLRLGQRRRPVAWELSLILAGLSLMGALLVRAAYLFDLLWSGQLASFGVLHQAMILIELHGFVLAATLAVQLRLLPSLARTRPVSGWAEYGGIVALLLGLGVQLVSLVSGSPEMAVAGRWLEALAMLALFTATGLWRQGVAPTVQAAATRLPGRTRPVLRVAWAGLLVGERGRATGLRPADAATHAVTSVYLGPLIVVVGIRMLPRVSAYPIRYPVLCGALVWATLAGGVLRAFGGAVGSQAGWQIAWFGGSLVMFAVLIFAAMAWSPWGVPTGVPRAPEVCARR